MKNIRYVCLLMLAGLFIQCEPSEDRDTLGPELAPADIKFSVTQEAGFDNKVYLENQTSGAMVLWDYVLNTSKRDKDTVYFPFPGEYWIKYKAFGRGGASLQDSVKITVSKFCGDCITDPAIITLTNKTAGKTWALDMVQPMGWCGLDYGKASGDNWSWFPSYADAGWTMANKDWGYMTFDLNGNFNAKVVQTALVGDAQTTKNGSFALDTKKNRLKFVNAEMLYGGDYYPDASIWNDVQVLELTETSLRLAVKRDQSRTGEGICLIMFHYKVKE